MHDYERTQKDLIRAIQVCSTSPSWLKSVAIQQCDKLMLAHNEAREKMGLKPITYKSIHPDPREYHNEVPPVVYISNN